VRAVVVERFGGPDVLELKEIERPEPGPGELLVRVVCAGTNPVDAKLRQFGGGARVSAPVVLGYDVSGVVEAVGPGVKRFQPGDEVYYMLEVFGARPGAYAEYNVVPEEWVARRPASLSHEEAAAVPLACGTAWRASCGGSRCSRAKRCSSTAAQEAWVRSRCSWPRRAAPG